MPTSNYRVESERYAKCIEISKKVRWDIDKDVIRGREFDFSKKFLPDGLSKIDQLDFLTGDEQRFLSQIQGRTYANMFGFVERFIVAKILEITRNHWLGDQVALEALVRFCDEELKHEELFRRIEKIIELTFLQVSVLYRTSLPKFVPSKHTLGGDHLCNIPGLGGIRVDPGN